MISDGENNHSSVISAIQNVVNCPVKKLAYFF